MPVTRRNFLERVTATMLVGAVVPKVFAQSGSSFFDNISADTFKPFIGDAFNIALNGKSRGILTLVAVTQAPPVPPTTTKAAMGSKSTTQPFDTFTLKFRGSGIALPQETYTLTQLSLGSFPLFLVPGTSGGSPTYTSVFNLLKP